MSDERIIYVDEVTPDLIGSHGKAWKTDSAAVARRFPGGPPVELTVAYWVVYAPRAHPAWHSYSISAVSLRDHPGWPPANICLADATHEVMVYALNPDRRVAINDRIPVLMPANFAGQWKADSDDAAAEKIRQTVLDIVAGRLSPDTDYIRHWIHRFSDSNLKDKEYGGATRILVGDPPEAEIVIPPFPGPQDMH